MTKKTVGSPPTPLDSLTRDMFPETRAVLAELRSLIVSTLPETTERASFGRKSLNFSHPEVGYFCRLRPRDDWVAIEFEFGVLLPDPDGILVGNSCAKQVRYARFHSPNALPRAGLQRLLRAAVSLPRARSDRIALVMSGARLVVPGGNRRGTARRAPAQPLSTRKHKLPRAT